MNIAQAILAKPHLKEKAPEIYDRAKEIEDARKNYWARQKQQGGPKNAA